MIDPHRRPLLGPTQDSPRQTDTAAHKRVDGLTARVDGLSARADGITTRLDTLTDRQRRTEALLEHLADRLIRIEDDCYPADLELD